MRTKILALCLLAYSGASLAALGSTPSNRITGQTLAAVSTVVASGATPAAAAKAAYSVTEATLSTGTAVREFVGADGIVFAVSWDGPFLPDLRQLLGKHFDVLVSGAASKPKAGNSQVSLVQPEVVIHSGGHMRAFVGSAYIPAALPAGFALSDIH